VTKKILSPEDSTLFRQSIGEVTKIKQDTLLLSSKKKPKPFPQEKHSQTINSFENLAQLDLEKLAQEDSFSFLAPGLQKNTLKKLRKGHIRVGASIDLHGLTSTEPRRQLSQFIHSSIEDGFRCIHIIHGKGYGSFNNHPVLKNDVNLWLRQYKEVQAFCSTPPKSGGTGAVFVLLKLSEKYGEEDNP
jgi:DNA-nicking Smr family endonuclease